MTLKGSMKMLDNMLLEMERDNPELLEIKNFFLSLTKVFNFVVYDKRKDLGNHSAYFIIIGSLNEILYSRGYKVIGNDKSGKIEVVKKDKKQAQSSVLNNTRLGDLVGCDIEKETLRVLYDEFKPKDFIIFTCKNDQELARFAKGKELNLDIIKTEIVGNDSSYAQTRH